MNTPTQIATIFVSTPPAPWLPNTVWEDPPKAAPRSAPLPLESRTTRITARQAITCTKIIAVFITTPS